MDPAPRAFAELPRDPELGLPVPFACGTPSHRPRRGVGPTVRVLEGRRVTQCALSRVCGVCGAALGRPLAFLGSRAEADRNAFHFPPCHVGCAIALRHAVAEVPAAVLGQPEQVSTWVLTTSPAFEFVRPGGTDADPRPTFRPVQSLLSTPPGRGPA